MQLRKNCICFYLATLIYNIEYIKRQIYLVRFKNRHLYLKSAYKINKEILRLRIVYRMSRFNICRILHGGENMNVMFDWQEQYLTSEHTLHIIKRNYTLNNIKREKR